MYHVYVDRTDAGTPFYVGKGNDDRVRMLRKGRNGKHGSVCRNHGQHREIVFSHENEVIVLNEEIKMIDMLHTWVHDPEATSLACNFVRDVRGWSKTGTTKQRISERTKEAMAKLDPVWKDRQRQAMSKPEVRTMISERTTEAMHRFDVQEKLHKSRDNNRTGYRTPEETKQKIRLKLMGRRLSEEQKKKRREAMKFKHDEVHTETPRCN